MRTGEQKDCLGFKLDLLWINEQAKDLYSDSNIVWTHKYFRKSSLCAKLSVCF